MKRKQDSQPLEIKPIEFPKGLGDDIQILRDEMMKMVAIPREVLEPLLNRQVSSKDYLFWSLK